MSDEEDKRHGSSGIFKVIVEGAKKLKRAVTESDAELSPAANLLAVTIGQAFIAGRFGDVHALGTPPFQNRTSKEAFESSWRATLAGRTLTGFSITDAGHIDLGYVPGLEEVSQDDFVGFAQITFSTPEAKLEDEKAFAIAAVLLDHDGTIRLGALHAR
ncbi:MAG TPA: hypothetical protein VIV11_35140 [Kofleriaceae bacterium]